MVIVGWLVITELMAWATFFPHTLESVLTGWLPGQPEIVPEFVDGRLAMLPTDTVARVSSVLSRH